MLSEKISCCMQSVGPGLNSKDTLMTRVFQASSVNGHLPCLTRGAHQLYTLPSAISYDLCFSPEYHFCSCKCYHCTVIYISNRDQHGHIILFVVFMLAVTNYKHKIREKTFQEKIFYQQNLFMNLQHPDIAVFDKNIHLMYLLKNEN